MDFKKKKVKWYLDFHSTQAEEEEEGRNLAILIWCIEFKYEIFYELNRPTHKKCTKQSKNGKISR